MDINKATELNQTLNRVMDMLKFAEAKNVVLFTFESGLVYALISEYSTQITGNWYLLFFGLPIYISLLLLLISFIPNLFKSENSNSSTNIQFFGDISKVEKNKYGEEYSSKIENKNDFYDDLICQIHYNSKITNKKFTLFKYALSILLVLPIVVKIIVHIYNKVTNKISEV